MHTSTIAEYLANGYELVVRQHVSGAYHAQIILGSTRSSHNTFGETIEAAIENLNNYVYRLQRP